MFEPGKGFRNSGGQEVWNMTGEFGDALDRKTHDGPYSLYEIVTQETEDGLVGSIGKHPIRIFWRRRGNGEWERIFESGNMTLGPFPPGWRKPTIVRFLKKEADNFRGFNAGILGSDTTIELAARLIDSLE